MDPGVVARVRLREAGRITRFLSSERFAGTETAAITLGYSIYIRKVDAFDPHSPRGLALLGHEVKHVEQLEREGVLRFFAKYFWAYLFRGYGEGIPFEAEAYEFEREVKNHLEEEFGDNLGQAPCQELAEPHTPNQVFIKTKPEVFNFTQ